MVAEKHLNFSTLFEDDEHTTVHHEIGHLTLRILRGSFQDIDDLDGTIDFHILRHIDQHAILCQHRIKGRDGIVGDVSQTSVIFLDEMGVFTQ